MRDIYPDQEEEQIPHYSLTGILKENQKLALDLTKNFLTFVECNDGQAKVKGTIQLTNLEASILLPLLAHFPYHTPHEVLYTSFYGGNISSEKDIAKSRQKLHEALELGVYDDEMRPVRNHMSRARFKLRSFGIDISAIVQTGYILTRDSQTYKFRQK